jgi:hypothetical protein
VWSFEVNSKNWTLLFANKQMPEVSAGSSGQFGSTFYPMYRSLSACASDGQKIYLFGGEGKGGSASVFMNDLWVFDVSLRQWAWLSGDTTGAQAVTSYSKIAGPSNFPSIRKSASLHYDGRDGLWVRK